ncbi:unnamed protein product [Zymoseptoria tritici ST99CH_3D7]|uniref:Uncharacterized protein n=1 Tax=Zymoseptoria tritici (strain ST99CH_3D7) TaxID=1276538 RepID=A0A1X7RE67_ZYMT9|nr:unnamed protein product [Zymoseptoria tritici ST99CH_3D7]
MTTMIHAENPTLTSTKALLTTRQTDTTARVQRKKSTILPPMRSVHSCIIRDASSISRDIETYGARRALLSVTRPVRSCGRSVATAVSV